MSRLWDPLVCHSSTGSLDLGALVFKQSIPWVFYTISNIHEFLITQFLQGRKCLFWSIIKLNKDYVQGRKLLQVARKDSFLWYIGAEFCKWIDGGYPGRGGLRSSSAGNTPVSSAFFLEWTVIHLGGIFGILSKANLLYLFLYFYLNIIFNFCDVFVKILNFTFIIHFRRISAGGICKIQPQDFNSNIFRIV